MFAKILVPLDGSPLSEEILPRACWLAQLLKAELTLLKVVDRHSQEQYGFDHLSGDSFDAYLEKVRHNLINLYKFSDHDQKWLHTRLAFGNVVEEILHQSEAEKADLLMMTTHGCGGLSTLIMGSVAAAVLQHCPIPLILLRPDKSFKLGEHSTTNTTEPLSLGRGVGSLLVTLDGTIEAEAILNPVSELACQLNTTLHLLRVIQPTIPLEELGDWVDINLYRGNNYISTHAFEYLKQKTENYLDSIQKRLSDQKVKSIKVVKVGEPSEEIVRYAQEIDAGLIAMASHGRGRVSQLLLGSVAAAVTNESGLPVMLVNFNIFQPPIQYLNQASAIA